MADTPSRRLLYIVLIGLAAIVPLLINRYSGPLFALASVACVILYIGSDRQERQQSNRRGFPVILIPPTDKAKPVDE